MDTSEFVFGDDLYLDSGGNLSSEKQFDANCIQKIGMVLRSHASQGVIWVNNIDRCNDIPSVVNVTGNMSAMQLISCDTIDTDDTGLFTCGSDSSASLEVEWSNAVVNVSILDNSTIVRMNETFVGNLSSTFTNHSLGNLQLIGFNSSCSGFRHKSSGGVILSCS